MISTRYVPVIGLMLALALVPTFIHSYAGGDEDDGRKATALPSELAGYRSVPSDRNETWGQRRFESNDWVERIYSNGKGDSLTLTVIRSLDAKSLYHHPELAISYHRTTFASDAMHHSPRRPDVPIHVLKPAPGQESLGLYALHYDTRFIDNPIWFQVRTSGELLFSRRKPMTIFFVLDENSSESNDIEQSSALTVLLAAVDAFVNQPAR